MEATASPIEASDIGDDITLSEAIGDDDDRKFHLLSILVLQGTRGINNASPILSDEA